MCYYKHVKLEVHGEDHVMQIWKNEMVRHWQYNVILTKNTGAIKYSVSDSVEAGKGHNCEQKETASKCWSGQRVKSWQ